ncbi:MAG: hypothetical protein H6684_15635 [Deltaproteobacteria bacterium]|nr:hypothetical protein [Deltaproteobacteria bacterium]MCB9490162.1 hypothetical protein [Deltaproteobacteria bacterium]
MTQEILRAAGSLAHLVATLLLVAGLATACTKKDEPKGEPTSTAPTAVAPKAVLKTDPPAKPPYTLETDDEKVIDLATDRQQIVLLTREQAKAKLEEYQVELLKCDEEDAKREDICQQRIASFYCMLMGDRYRDLGDGDGAFAFYSEAIKRTRDEHDVSEKLLEKAKADAPADPTAKAIDIAYHEARYNFQSYKDFAETARYHKRLAELMILAKNDPTEHWDAAKENIKKSAEHLAKFEKAWDDLQALEDKAADADDAKFQEIERYAKGKKIERI